MITFYNPGKLDIRALKLSGLSVKESKSPIGYFGTGLKYAVAVLRRYECAVTLVIDNVSYDIIAKDDEFRGVGFKQLYLKSFDQEVELPIVSEMGKDWQPWMAFRELYTNALDEGGGVTDQLGVSADATNKTLIQVTGKVVDEIYANMNNYFITDTSPKPIYSTECVDVYESMGMGKMFNFGILVKNTGAHLYTYNIKKKCMLTEDRNLSWSDTVADTEIARMFVECTDPKIIEKFMLEKNFYEATVHSYLYRHSKNVTTEFMETYRKLAKNTPSKIANGIHKYMQDQLGVPIISEDQHVKLDEFGEMMLAKAKAFLTDFIEVDKYPIIVVDVENDLHGFVVKDQEIIYLNKKAFEKGTLLVAMAIYEEWTHLHTGFGDGYEMQKYYLQKILHYTQLWKKIVL